MEQWLVDLSDGLARLLHNRLRGNLREFECLFGPYSELQRSFNGRAIASSSSERFVTKSTTLEGGMEGLVEPARNPIRASSVQDTLDSPRLFRLLHHVHKKGLKPNHDYVGDTTRSDLPV